MVKKRQTKERIQPQQLVKRLTQKENLQTLDPQEIKDAAIAHYGDGWGDFFVQWAIRAQQQHQETIAKIEHAKEEVKVEVKNEADKVMQVQKQEANKIIQAHKQENHLLNIELEKLKESLSYVQARELERETAEKEALERKAKKEHRKRLPLRDAATYPEFNHAIKVVENQYRVSPFTKARDKIALLILFFTGIRVSNILYCTVNSLNTLLNKGVFSLPAIKSRNTGKIEWPVSASTQELAIQLKNDIQILCQGKEGNENVMTIEGGSQPMHRVTFDTRLNRILKQTSKEMGKNVSTHSFRIGQATHLIEIAGLVNAQKLMGHQDVRTTALYNRSSLTIQKKNELIRKLEKAKRTRIPRKWKKKKEFSC